MGTGRVIAGIDKVMQQIDQVNLRRMKKGDDAYREKFPQCLSPSRTYVLSQHQSEWSEDEISHAATCEACGKVRRDYVLDQPLFDVRTEMREELAKEQPNLDRLLLLEKKHNDLLAELTRV